MHTKNPAARILRLRDSLYSNKSLRIILLVDVYTHLI